MSISFLTDRLAICPYCRYFLVGSVVGCLAILAREIIAALLPADSPAYYMLSVVLVYAGGILASYWGHRTISFRSAPGSLNYLRSLSTFAVIAISGMLSTVLLSALFRYGMGLGSGKYQPTLAFALATVATSGLTYWMNKHFTFRANTGTFEQVKVNGDDDGKRPVVGG